MNHLTFEPAISHNQSTNSHIQPTNSHMQRTNSDIQWTYLVFNQWTAKSVSQLAELTHFRVLRMRTCT